MPGDGFYPGIDSVGKLRDDQKSVLRVSAVQVVNDLGGGELKSANVETCIW